MEQLYLELGSRKILISDKVVQKYDLKKGTLSPFTKSRIVNEAGEFVPPKNNNKDNYKKMGLDRVSESNIQENLDLSTSEILDFSQGADSDNG